MSRIEEAVDDVADNKTLDGLVLGDGLAVDAQRTRLTCQRPFLLRPWLRRLTVILACCDDRVVRVSGRRWRRLLTVVCWARLARARSPCARRRCLALSIGAGGVRSLRGGCRPRCRSCCWGVRCGAGASAAL